MSKRMQVLLEDGEWRITQRAAREQGITIAAYVRNALKSARQQSASGDAAKKLQIVRAAARHAFPTAGVEQMNAEIERGYARGLPVGLP